ncbi:MAG: 16S rRNA (adenine(1518)-N(6)/adenine(1519)-N(6))-dimethyltransferase RsmA [Candidatus Omnitrophota bacterium]
MHLKPKKRLGQNFLTDKNIQNKILGSLELKPSDFILEIGAGSGEFTGLLAKKVKKVYAVEIDRDLYSLLEERIKDYTNVSVIKKDILKLNLQRYFAGLNKKIKVFGNIPYYISTPIIVHLLKFRRNIEIIFITVQKEFAKRITASAGSKDYGSLSCFVQYYTNPKKVFEIKRTSFFPSPKVDSCLLRLDPREKMPLGTVKEEFLFKAVRAAFNQRRKTLRNSLKGLLPPEKLERFFLKYSIDKNTRPESLAPQDFINLINS